MAGTNANHYNNDPANQYNSQYYHTSYDAPPPTHAPPPYIGASPPYQQHQQQDGYTYNQQQHGPPPPPGRYAYVASSAPLPARHPRVIFFITIIRPWAIVAPFLTIVMDIWWFSTGRLCGGIDDVGSDCFLVLWYSLPIAVVSMLWSLATTISARRAAHHRKSIPSRVQLPVQTLVAIGATACLALLSVHLANSDWIRSNTLQGGMAALLSVITLVNWLLVGSAGYEWNLDRKHARQADNFVL
jgi:hypothetical protein